MDFPTPECCTLYPYLDYCQVNPPPAIYHDEDAAHCESTGACTLVSPSAAYKANLLQIVRSWSADSECQALANVAENVQHFRVYHEHVQDGGVINLGHAHYPPNSSFTGIHIEAGHRPINNVAGTMLHEALHVHLGLPASFHGANFLSIESKCRLYFKHG